MRSRYGSGMFRLPGWLGPEKASDMMQTATPRSNILNFERKQPPMEASDDRELDRQEQWLREALAKVQALRHRPNQTVPSVKGGVVDVLFAARNAAAERVATLTPREREILDLVVAGRPSKIIAWELGISRRTVENHRASIMHKTDSKSIPALARLAISAAWCSGDGSFARRLAPASEGPEWIGTLEPSAQERFRVSEIRTKPGG